MIRQKVFAVGPLFLFGSLFARAEGPTLRLNNPGSVITEPTEVTVDLVMPDDPDQVGVAALIVIEYDPAMVTLSDHRPSNPTLWNDFSIYPFPELHQLRVLMLTASGSSGPTATGSLLAFTVSPVGASADLSECGTLRLVGGAYGQEFTSHLAIYRPSLQDWDSVWAPSSCGPLGPIYVPPGEDSATTGDGTQADGTVDSTDGDSDDGPDGPSGPSFVMCDIDLPAIQRALRIAGGIVAATATDIQTLDWNRDGMISVPDAVLLARNPCARIHSVNTFEDELDMSPVIYDMNGDGLPEVVIGQAQYLYAEPGPEPLNDPNNHNKIFVYQWDQGDLQLLPNWPQKLRDAPPGAAIANVNGGNRILVSVSQDNYAQSFKPSDWPTPNIGYFASRIYTWDRNATPIQPWAPWAFLTGPDTGAGLVHGHALSAPVVYDLLGNGSKRIIQTGQGKFSDWDNNRECPSEDTPDACCYYRYGSLRIWSEIGTLLKETSTTSGTNKLLIVDNAHDPASSNFSISIPPVVATLSGNANCVVTATEDGRLYAWDTNGNPVSGWYPSANGATQTEVISGSTTRRATVTQYNSMAAVDFDGIGNEDIILTTGDFRPAYNYGKVYRFRHTGGAPYRSYPSGAPASPAISSGVAVGRIRRAFPNQKCIVVGDSMGHVIALDPDLNPFWTATTTLFNPIAAEPTIGDVNNDGYQDVVVGGTDGYVYAFDGDTGAILWRVPTPTSTINGNTYRDAITGAPTLAKLANDNRLYVVVVTFTRLLYNAICNCFPAQGHLMVIDCGPTNTNGTSRYDWPQYQHDAQRTGKALPDL